VPAVDGRWKLSDWLSRDVLVVARLDADPLERARALAPEAAVWGLSGWADSGDAHHALAEMAAAVEACPIDFPRTASHQLLGAVARAIETGRLLVVPVPERRMVIVAAEPARAAQGAAEPAPARKEVVWVRLEIHPEEAAACGDRFTLEGTGGYRQTRTVADDRIPGDACIDLEFVDVDPSQHYRLSIAAADGAGYAVFDRMPFGELESWDGTEAAAGAEPSHSRPEEVGGED